MKVTDKLDAGNMFNYKYCEVFEVYGVFARSFGIQEINVELFLIKEWLWNIVCSDVLEARCRLSRIRTSCG